MNRTIHIAEFLGFIKNLGDEDGFGSVCYVPAHMHSPGDDVPCSSSFMLVL